MAAPTTGARPNVPTAMQRRHSYERSDVLKTTVVNVHHVATAGLNSRQFVDRGVALNNIAKRSNVRFQGAVRRVMNKRGVGFSHVVMRVRDELLFDHERGRLLVPFHFQQDPKVNTAAAVALRKTFRKHARVVEAMEYFWRTYRRSSRRPRKGMVIVTEDAVNDAGRVQYIRKEEYMDVHMKMAKCLDSAFCIKDARAQAKQDYDEDTSHGDKLLVRSVFRDSLFQLADLWTPSVDPLHYCLFLYRLYARITRPAETQATPTRQWKDLQEIRHFTLSELGLDDLSSDDAAELVAAEIKALGPVEEVPCTLEDESTPPVSVEPVKTIPARAPRRTRSPSPEVTPVDPPPRTVPSPPPPPPQRTPAPVQRAPPQPPAQKEVEPQKETKRRRKRKAKPKEVPSQPKATPTPKPRPKPEVNYHAPPAPKPRTKSKPKVYPKQHQPQAPKPAKKSPTVKHQQAKLAASVKREKAPPKPPLRPSIGPRKPARAAVAAKQRVVHEAAPEKQPLVREAKEVETSVRTPQKTPVRVRSNPKSSTKEPLVAASTPPSSTSKKPTPTRHRNRDLPPTTSKPREVLNAGAKRPPSTATSAVHRPPARNGSHHTVLVKPPDADTTVLGQTHKRKQTTEMQSGATRAPHSVTSSASGGASLARHTDTRKDADEMTLPISSHPITPSAMPTHFITPARPPSPPRVRYMSPAPFDAPVKRRDARATQGVSIIGLANGDQNEDGANSSDVSDSSVACDFPQPTSAEEVTDKSTEKNTNTDDVIHRNRAHAQARRMNYVVVLPTVASTTFPSEEHESRTAPSEPASDVKPPASQDKRDHATAASTMGTSSQSAQQRSGLRPLKPIKSNPVGHDKHNSLSVRADSPVDVHALPLLLSSLSPTSSSNTASAGLQLNCSSPSPSPATVSPLSAGARKGFKGNPPRQRKGSRKTSNLPTAGNTGMTVQDDKQRRSLSTPATGPTLEDTDKSVASTCAQQSEPSKAVVLGPVRPPNSASPVKDSLPHAPADLGPVRFGAAPPRAHTPTPYTVTRKDTTGDHGSSEQSKQAGDGGGAAPSMLPSGFKGHRVRRAGNAAPHQRAQPAGGSVRRHSEHRKAKSLARAGARAASHRRQPSRTVSQVTVGTGLCLPSLWSAQERRVLQEQQRERKHEELRRPVRRRSGVGGKLELERQKVAAMAAGISGKGGTQRCGPLQTAAHLHYHPRGLFTDDVPHNSVEDLANI